MKKLPIILIYSRLLAGLLLLTIGVFHYNASNILIVSLFSYGLISDILDGIIARHLNVSTPALRRLDSSIDQVFWVSALIGAFMKCPDFFHANYGKMIVLLGLETLTYVVSFLKFRKEVATHAILSKIWTLTIFATIIQIMTTCQSSWLFDLCFYVGVITRIEIIFILLLIRQWTNDVPSLYHAVLLRQGKTIKRHKMFNG